MSVHFGGVISLGLNAALAGEVYLFTGRKKRTARHPVNMAAQKEYLNVPE